MLLPPLHPTAASSTKTALLSGSPRQRDPPTYPEASRPKNGGIWLVAEWTKGRRDCLQPLPGWFSGPSHEYGRQNSASRLYDKHRSERLDRPAEPLFFVPHHTARSLNIDLKAAGIEKSTPEGKIDFHACAPTSRRCSTTWGPLKNKEVLLRHAPRPWLTNGT